VLGWTLCAGVVRPKSRGRIRLTGPDPTDPVQIEANMLAYPDDLKAAIAGMELCREIGNSAPLRPWAKRVRDHGGRATPRRHRVKPP
jgi:choline dehydrogenase